MLLSKLFEKKLQLLFKIFVTLRELLILCQIVTIAVALLFELGYALTEVLILLAMKKRGGLIGGALRDGVALLGYFTAHKRIVDFCMATVAAIVMIRLIMDNSLTSLLIIIISSAIALG